MIAPAAPTADTTRAWSWKLNWFRQSELDGALLLGRMVRSTDDAYLIAALTRHCADEARHSLLWSQAIAAARLPAVRIHRPYQSFYWDQSPPPRTLPEVLAVTHVFEQRVDQTFQAELARPDLPAPVRRTLAVMIADEQDHLDWIRRWLANRPDADALLAQYRAADDRVARDLTPYFDHLWDVPGLGDEPPTTSEETAPIS